MEEISINIQKGDTINHTYKYPGDYPAITGKTIFDSPTIYIRNCCVFVDHSSVKKPKYIESGDLLIMVDGFSNLGKTCIYLGEQKCLLGNSTISIKHNQNPKFLVNVLSTEYVKSQIKGMIKKGVVQHLYPSDIKKIKIPIPPLEIQNQIANFLDKFTNLKNELDNESRKRDQQYEYYKELIFNERNRRIKN